MAGPPEFVSPVQLGVLGKPEYASSGQHELSPGQLELYMELVNPADTETWRCIICSKEK